MSTGGHKIKILYVHQYFKTPEEGGSLRSYYLAKGLVQKGIEVVLITTHNKPHYLQKEIEGIKVHYLPISYSNHLSFYKRIIAFVRFIFKSIRTAHQIKAYNLCYVMTTPLSTGVIALYIKYVRKVPYIFEVGDLWPSVPIDMGIIQNRFLKKIFFSFEKWVYRKAKALVALSPDIADYIRSIVPKKQIVCIPNIADTHYFEPNLTKTSTFRIGYFGTAGIANRLTYLLAAAKEAQKQSVDIHFDIMAEGADLTNIMRKKEEMKLDNISFHEYGGKEKVKEQLKLCDAIYVSFANTPVLATGSPNKFFDGLSAGKLIIINFEGWIKKIIEKHACGISYEPNDPSSFIQRMRPFLQNNDLLVDYQKNARKLAESNYSKELALTALYELVMSRSKMKT